MNNSYDQQYAVAILNTLFCRRRKICRLDDRTISPSINIMLLAIGQSLILLLCWAFQSTEEQVETQGTRRAVEKMADRFSRFNEERDFQVNMIKNKTYSKYNGCSAL